MNTRLKSTLLLVSMLLLGAVLGALLNARMAEERIDRIAFLRTQQGFTRAIERVVEPTGEAQRQAVRAILDDAALRIGTQLQQNRLAMQAILDSTRAALGSVLTDEQMEQVNERLEVRRFPNGRDRRGPPGRPPRP